MNQTELKFIEKIRRAKQHYEYDTARSLLLEYIAAEDEPSVDILYEYTELLVLTHKTDQAEEFINSLLPIENSVRMLLLAAQIKYDKEELTACMNYLNTIFATELAPISPKLKTIFYSLVANIHWKYLSNPTECRKASQLALANSVNNYELLGNHASIAFVSNYDPTLSESEIAKLHFQFQELFSKIIPYKHSSIRHHSKIRIGYLSADFCIHAVVYFFFPLFASYDKTAFEVFCYSSTPHTKYDILTTTIKDSCDCWRDITNVSETEAVEIIYKDKLDILFDLSGYTDGARPTILAFKPAPIQITGIGYINTSGLKTVDYILSDKYCDEPDGHEHFFSETRLSLPDTHICYKSPVQCPGIKELPYLRNGYITFGSFNKFVRTTDEMLKLWLTILNKIPNSKLLLKSSPFNKEFSTKYIMDRLISIGFKPEQLICRPLSKNWLHEYNDIDIAFDTFPCNGITTLCDALYMGVPVMTLTDERRTSRFGYSILKNLGLDECIANSNFEFIVKTVKLAKNISHLKKLHETLHDKMNSSPLMNDTLYMHNLETAYKKIIADWQKKHN